MVNLRACFPFISVAKYSTILIESICNFEKWIQLEFENAAAAGECILSIIYNLQNQVAIGSDWVKQVIARVKRESVDVQGRVKACCTSSENREPRYVLCY